MSWPIRGALWMLLIPSVMWVWWQLAIPLALWLLAVDNEWVASTGPVTVVLVSAVATAVVLWRVGRWVAGR